MVWLGVLGWGCLVLNVYFKRGEERGDDTRHSVPCYEHSTSIVSTNG